MSSLDEFIGHSRSPANLATHPNILSKPLPPRGFEQPPEAILAELEALRKSDSLVQLDPYPPKPLEPAIFSLGRVQFSLEQPLRFLLCNSHILLFLLVPANPTNLAPPQLVRIDLGQPSVVDSISLSIPSLFQSASQSRNQQPSPPTTIHRVHCDPTGRHVLVSLESGENYYVSLSPTSINQHRAAAQLASRRGPQSTALSPAIRLLTKLRGLVISSVGWHHSSYSAIPATSTKEIILGTTDGALFSTLIVDHHSQEPASDLSITAAFSRIDRSAPDRYLKPLYNLSESAGQSTVTGIWWDVWYQHAGQNKTIKRAMAIVTTSSRLHQFVDQVGLVKNRREDDDSEGILERLFNPYHTARVMSKSLELPAPVHNSELHVYQPTSSDPTSSSSQPSPILSWLTGAGIYCGEILHGTQEAGDGVIVATQLIPYPASELAAPPASLNLSRSSQSSPVIDATVPLSFCSTEFHFVLLYQDRVQIVCRLDSQVVHEESLDLRPDEHIQMLSSDPINQTYWLYSEESIFELVVKNESQNIWKVFLARQSFEAALQHANTPADRDSVLIKQADHYLETKKFIPAAQIYAQCSKSFEDVVLGFIDLGERDALRYYLISRLERLKRQDLTQRMMLATWLTEIYLAKINELEDMAGSESSSDEAANIVAEQRLVEDELQQFLRTYRANLDQRTTYDLITSHGRMDVMIYYANLVGDHERIIRHYILEEDWKKAIDGLNRQDDLELYYRFAPVLVKYDARAATTAFMRQPKLDVKRLIPALIPARSRVRAQEANGDNTEVVIEYLKFAVGRLNNSDAPVHNALLTLFATQAQADEGALLRFLATTPDNPMTGRPYYDLDYALRVCKTNKKLQSCGLIYSKMGLYESSVDLALQTGDLELAKVNAEKPEDDVLLRKKLWLKIAEHVVHHQKDIKTAMEFLESTDLLKIEDILPFFPDFVVIDDFKQEICTALDNYSAHIQKLKQDMEESNRAAELIKGDLAKLSTRFLIISQEDECCCCEEKLLTRQFYVFPCQHSFHADCLIKEVTKHMPPHQLRRMLTLQTKLSQIRAGAGPGQDGRTGLWANGGEGSSLLSDSKKLAMASVQGLDQVRKLIIPDALVDVIGGGVGVIGSGVGALGGVLPIPRVARLRQPTADTESTATQRTLSPNQSPTGSVSGTAKPVVGLSQLETGASLGTSLRKTKEGKKMMTSIEKWKEELDELLASKCALCEWALESIDKGFVGDGEVDI